MELSLSPLSISRIKSQATRSLLSFATNWNEWMSEIVFGVTGIISRWEVTRLGARIWIGMVRDGGLVV
jgi:hypothetical protein